MADRPFKRINGAAAVIVDTIFDEAVLATTTTAHHPNQAGLKLIVVKGPALMQLVTSLYERACDEA